MALLSVAIPLRITPDKLVDVVVQEEPLLKLA